MIAAFEGSPDVLGRALALEWPGASDFMTGDAPLYTIGRGPGLAIAKEAALKLKETAGVFAQAYSSAEVLQRGRSPDQPPRLRKVTETR